ncbi:hypothetical protein J2T60_002448 [Natronospira proteinivora]|uniref:DUF4136 domain-containing protein n=1 Tax=Natronospira proteinivora TaxID=1807133 RepID=A0ABT1GDK8_9GAMM|nr:DUF4136 domain-containing protein [Natronospira proteinivora]MCP1728448.1 hypothetical protein [Natronospira proteinivora]
MNTTFSHSIKQPVSQARGKHHLGIWLLVCTAMLLTACAGTGPVEYDQSVDFERYQTFAWANPDRRQVKDPVLDSELLDRRMANAIRQTLTAKGLEEVAAEDADLLVTYHTISRERLSNPHVRVHLSYGPGYPYYPHWHARRHHPGPIYYHDQRSYQEGTLIIDVVDRQQNELVWRGWRAGEVRPSRFRDDQLRQQVDRILHHFPPDS